MIGNKNLVIALATLGALNTYVCNAAEQKEHQEFAAPIAYRADGKLCVAVDNQIIEAGTEPQTLHTADEGITALACSPTDVDTLALTWDEANAKYKGLNDTVSALKRGEVVTKTKERSRLANPTIRFFKGTDKFIVDQFTDTYPILFPTNKQYKLGLPHGIIFFDDPHDQGRMEYLQLTDCDTSHWTRAHLRGTSLKTIAYSPTHLVALTQARIFELYLSPQDYTTVKDFKFTYESEVHLEKTYSQIELSKVKPGKRPTLIATKPERGADLYSITRPWFSRHDTLVKTTSIETDGEVQHIDSTPARGLFSPARTALSTPQTIHEIDSRSGEEIARYDKATAKQTYWNWWRTARRTAYATAATLTSVAAAVLSYKWFSNRSNK